MMKSDSVEQKGLYMRHKSMGGMDSTPERESIPPSHERVGQISGSVYSDLMRTKVKCGKCKEALNLSGKIACTAAKL